MLGFRAPILLISLLLLFAAPFVSGAQVSSQAAQQHPEIIPSESAPTTPLPKTPPPPAVAAVLDHSDTSNKTFPSDPEQYVFIVAGVAILTAIGIFYHEKKSAK